MHREKLFSDQECIESHWTSFYNKSVDFILIPCDIFPFVIQLVRSLPLWLSSESNHRKKKQLSWFYFIIVWFSFNCTHSMFLASLMLYSTLVAFCNVCCCCYFFFCAHANTHIHWLLFVDLLFSLTANNSFFVSLFEYI